LHAKGEQRFDGMFAHWPNPLHFCSVGPPSAQPTADPQEVSDPGYVHLSASFPSHLPTQGAVPVHASRLPCGSPETSTHLPIDPVTSQAAHCAMHELSQQTPSTQ
jgi:hypothetical protein